MLRSARADPKTRLGETARRRKRAALDLRAPKKGGGGLSFSTAHVLWASDSELTCRRVPLELLLRASVLHSSQSISPAVADLVRAMPNLEIEERVPRVMHADPPAIRQAHLTQPADLLAAAVYKFYSSLIMMSHQIAGPPNRAANDSNMAALDERFERLQCAAALVSRMEHTDLFEVRPRSLGPVRACVAR